MKRPKNFLEELAGVFHAGLGLGNGFVAYYNYRKGNKKRAMFHLGIVIWEALCFHDHWGEKEIRRGN